MFVGACAAIAQGAVLPAFSIIFGDFINIFLNQEITYNVVPLFEMNFDPNSVACNDTSVFNSTYFGKTVFDITEGEQNCSYVVVENVSTYDSVLKNCFGEVVSCSNNSMFISGVNELVYIFIGIALGIFVMGYIQVSLFQAACERQVKKIRLAFYRAIMRQEIGWFDATPTGELSSRLAE